MICSSLCRFFICKSPKKITIGLTNQLATRFVLRSTGGHSTLNLSLIDPAARCAQSLEHAAVERRTLDTVSIDISVQRIDFMSIDIEGHEMEMFAGFTIDRWKPTLIHLEDHVLNHAKHHFMTSHGYQLILRTGINSWCVPVTQSFDLMWASKFERFRKYWLGLLGRKLKYGA